MVWLRRHGKLDWTGSNQRSHCPMSNHKSSIETPAQQIKQLERELADERDRNLILNTMTDIYDKNYVVNLRKSLSRQPLATGANGQVSLAKGYRLVGISTQAVYQYRDRQLKRADELAVLSKWIDFYRQFMPKLGGRKLYYLLKPKHSYTKLLTVSTGLKNILTC